MTGLLIVAALWAVVVVTLLAVWNAAKYYVQRSER